MSTLRAGTAIESLTASAYTFPTATDEESDGTLTWSSTSIVVVRAAADGRTGIGYTYSDPAVAEVIASNIAELTVGADALMPERCWAKAQVQLRQLGHTGLAAMALSAVDVALWDLKARLLGVCLADLLPRFHESVPIYGSGGFTNLTEAQLREQVDGWLDAGVDRVKIKVGSEKPRDPDRVARTSELAGAGVTVMVDGNGAYTPAEALLWAERFAELGVDYFEEPVSSQDLDGLADVRRRAPAGMAIAAGEYGWNLPYFEAMLRAGAVHILQADVTRCGGITNLLRIDGLTKARNLAFSAHCAPAISAHACCAMETAIHIEYFFDHQRIERMLFGGVLEPRHGRLTPDRDRPGLGITFDAEAAEPYAAANVAPR
jgi:L-alanine-DL-glutamate epimerase-like enolase superfamily enzyme